MSSVVSSPELLFLAWMIFTAHETLFIGNDIKIYLSKCPSSRIPCLAPQPDYVPHDLLFSCQGSVMSDKTLFCQIIYVLSAQKAHKMQGTVKPDTLYALQDR